MIFFLALFLWTINARGKKRKKEQEEKGNKETKERIENANEPLTFLSF